MALLFLYLQGLKLPIKDLSFGQHMETELMAEEFITSRDHHQKSSPHASLIPSMRRMVH